MNGGLFLFDFSKTNWLSKKTVELALEFSDSQSLQSFLLKRKGTTL